MTRYNLDKSKQYATDRSTDGGKTWTGESSGWCSEGVQWDLDDARRDDRTVDQHGGAIHIHNGDGSITRWTPTS